MVIVDRIIVNGIDQRCHYPKYTSRFRKQSYLEEIDENSVAKVHERWSPNFLA